MPVLHKTVPKTKVNHSTCSRLVMLLMQKIWKINIAVKTKLQEPKELSNFSQNPSLGKLCTGYSDAYQIKGSKLLKKAIFQK